MTSSTVGALYDALQAFEGPRRGGGAYPIHKRITFSGSTQDDVYGWLGDQLGLRSTDRVLDVGCGVGFGTILLAELDQASRAASRSTRAEAISFLKGSFERLPPGQFDVIVAVESLKHSSDLGDTLRRLREALAPGGRLVVVEDVFDGDPSCPSARRVVGDWLLTTLHREADYAAAMSPATFRVVDLTEGVRPSGRVALSAKLAAVNVTLVRQSSARASALRAFRGGLHLERLYAAGMMRYVAMFATKQDLASR